MNSNIFLNTLQQTCFQKKSSAKHPPANRVSKAFGDTLSCTSTESTESTATPSYWWRWRFCFGWWWWRLRQVGCQFRWPGHGGNVTGPWFLKLSFSLNVEVSPKMEQKIQISKHTIFFKAPLCLISLFNCSSKNDTTASMCSFLMNNWIEILMDEIRRSK